MSIVKNLNSKSGVVRNNYTGAKQNRLTSDWVLSVKTADEIIKSSITTLRERSRDLERNDDYVNKFFRLLEINVVGPKGIKVNNRAKLSNGKFDRDTNDLINREFKKWSKKKYASVSGRQSLLDIEKLVVRGTARDGESFIYQARGKNVNKYGYALQVLEPDLVDEKLNNVKLDNGNIIKMGIEYTPQGKVVALYLLTNHPGDFSYIFAGKKYKKYSADDIIHVYLEDRPTQSRGVPWAHTAIIRLRMLGGYEEAELVASRIAASKMGFFTQEGGIFEGEGKDDEGATVTDVEPGTFEKLPRGVGFESFDPSHPGGNFQPFVKAILRGVSAGLGPSYNSLSGDLESVNYSSLRQGALEERDFYRMLQEWFIESFMEPIFESWLMASMLTGAVPLPFFDFDRIHAPKFEARGWDWIDPLKEVKAAKDAISGVLASHQTVLSAKGMDFEDIVDQLAYENEYALSKGIVINDVTTITEKEIEDANKEEDQ